MYPEILFSSSKIYQFKNYWRPTDHEYDINRLSFDKVLSEWKTKSCSLSNNKCWDQSFIICDIKHLSDKSWIILEYHPWKGNDCNKTSTKTEQRSR